MLSTSQEYFYDFYFQTQSLCFSIYLTIHLSIYLYCPVPRAPVSTILPRTAEKKGFETSVTPGIHFTKDINLGPPPYCQLLNNVFLILIKDHSVGTRTAGQVQTRFYIRVSSYISSRTPVQENIKSCFDDHIFYLKSKKTDKRRVIQNY